MPGVPPQVQPVLAALAEGLGRLYGRRFAGLVLFGSHARGEAAASSDIDVAILLRGTVHEGRELQRVSELVWRLSLEHDQVIAVVPVSLQRYRSNDDVLLWRLRAEGIPAA